MIHVHFWMQSKMKQNLILIKSKTKPTLLVAPTRLALVPNTNILSLSPSLILRAKIGKTQNQKQKPKNRSWSTITTNPTTPKRKKQTKRAKLLPLPFLPFPVHLPKRFFFLPLVRLSLSLCIIYLWFLLPSSSIYACFFVPLSCLEVLSCFLSFFTQKRHLNYWKLAGSSLQEATVTGREVSHLLHSFSLLKNGSFTNNKYRQFFDRLFFSVNNIFSSCIFVISTLSIMKK